MSSNPFDQFDNLDGNPFDQFDAPAKKKGFLGNVAGLVKEGAASAITAARLSGDVATGNIDQNSAGLISKELSVDHSGKPKEFREVADSFAPISKEWKDAGSFKDNPLDNLSVVGKMIWNVGEQAVTNPKGLAYLTASQIANMAPSIAGMMAGAQAGATAGTFVAPGVGTAVGGVAGGVAGAFAGEWPMEAGSEFIGIVGKELSARKLEPTEQNVASVLADQKFMTSAVSQARTKATTTSAIDSAFTMGAGRMVGAPGRAAEKAARTELGAAATAAEVSAKAGEIVAARTMAQKVGNVSKAIGVDVAGGGLSEAGGQYNAYGQADLGDVGMEMLGELGGAGIEIPSAAWSAAKGELISSRTNTAPTPEDHAKNILDQPDLQSALDAAIVANTSTSAPTTPFPASPYTPSTELADFAAQEFDDVTARREALVLPTLNQHEIDRTELTPGFTDRGLLALPPASDTTGPTMTVDATGNVQPATADTFKTDMMSDRLLAVAAKQSSALGDAARIELTRRQEVNNGTAGLSTTSGLDTVRAPAVGDIAQRGGTPDVSGNGIGQPIVAGASGNGIPGMPVGSIEPSGVAGSGVRDGELDQPATILESPAAQQNESTNSLGRDSSWVIKNKDTGEVIMETFDKAKVNALNTEKYVAIPILQHLQGLNTTAAATPESAAPISQAPTSDASANPLQSLTPLVAKLSQQKANNPDLKIHFETAKKILSGEVAPRPLHTKQFANLAKKYRAAAESAHKVAGRDNANAVADNLQGIADVLNSQSQPAAIEAQVKPATTEADKAKRAELVKEAEGLGIKNAKFLRLDELPDAIKAKQESVKEEADALSAEEAYAKAVEVANNMLSENEIADIEDAVSRKYGDSGDRVLQEEMAKTLEAAIHAKQNEVQGEENQGNVVEAVAEEPQLGNSESDGDIGSKENEGAARGQQDLTEPATPPANVSTNSENGDTSSDEFDSKAWDKSRDDVIDESKAAGNRHLDQVTPSVEAMRGKTIYYAHNPKQRGVIRTVDNRGSVYVYWADEYSAEKELASESLEDNKAWLKSTANLPYLKTKRDGKVYVMQSSLGAGDLKDYVFANKPAGDAVAPTNPQAEAITKMADAMATMANAVKQLVNPDHIADTGKMMEPATEANVSDNIDTVKKGHRAAAQQILDAIGDDKLSDYGLRVIPGKFEGNISIGDVLPNSRVWDDGHETEEELDGTSTAGIKHHTIDGVIEALRNIGAHGKPGYNGFYYGDRVVLVKGVRIGSGEDYGESVIENAEVVGIWKKPTKGNSEVIQNESIAPSSNGADQQPKKPAQESVSYSDEEYDSLKKRAEKENSLVPGSMYRASFIEGFNDAINGRSARNSNTNAYHDGYSWGDKNKPAQEAKSEESAPIEDFGEKILGARKEYAAAYKDRMDEARNVDVLAQPLSKSWPEPDYQKLIDAGYDKTIVGLVRSMRDEIPNKPGKEWKQKTWAKQVELLRDTADKLLSDTEFADKFVAEMKKVEHLKLEDAINGRAELYAMLGHEKSLKGIRISRGQYGVYDGVPYSPPKVIWEVAKDARATAFGNMPSRLGSGDTRQAAIDSFAKAYSTLDTGKENSAKTKFELYADRYAKAGDKGQYFIGKRVGRNVLHIKDGFDTVKEARAYIAEHNEELAAILEQKKAIPNERYDINQPRVGQDMRNAQDVTPQMFSDAFKFRGVQFGNYVEGTRRQKDLNDAYDALMDLAAVLDVPPKALSLNGELGLAFGARGTGGKHPASAHYEPGQIVINLTKGNGAGSLAHEWWHSLDNYFSRLRGKKDAYATDGMDVSLAARGSDYHFKDDGIRKEMIDAFGAVVKAINNTAIRQRSGSLDSRRTKEYWGTGIEMSARSFERYVIAKLHDNGFANDYLANVVSEEYWNAADALGIGEGGSYPYPTESELPAIRSGFDKFFQTIETKETDQGTALFHRAWHGSPYDHDSFDMEYVGTGEGAQAYGHGLYFAGSREVAEWYKTKLSGGSDISTLRATKDGKDLSGYDLLEEYFKPGRQVKGYAGIDEVVSFSPQQYGDNYKPWNVVVKQVKDQRGNAPDRLDAAPRSHATQPDAKLVKEVLEADGWNVSKGRLYQVELAPAQDEYLDWDKPLSEQSEKVKAALASVAERFELRDDDSGASIYKIISTADADAARDNDQANDKAASEYLHSIGIRGIRYLDGSSRSAGEGNSNFVIFDDSDVSITEKFKRGNAQSGQPKAAVEAMAKKIMSHWKNAPVLTVVQSIEELPANLLDQVYSQNAQDDMEGVYLTDSKQVYLVADHLPTLQRSLYVLLHESIGHHGLRDIFGDGISPVMRQIYLTNKSVRIEADKLMKQYGYDAALATEEVLADMPGEGAIEKLNGWKRIVAYIMGKLRQWGVSDKWTDSDVISLLAKAGRHVIDGEGNLVMGGAQSALASRSDTATPSAAWKILSGDMAMFQNPTPDSFEMEQGAREIDPGMKAAEDKPDLDEEKTGIVRKWYVTMPDKTHAWVYENKQGEVWLNAADLAEGVSGGTKLYLLVGNYAEANGKVFIGDPAGLSDVALIRRTENMLSLALRFGSTEFMQPHEYQMNPESKLDTVLDGVARPITWVTGDDENNLSELLKTSYDNTVNLYPEIQNVTYNFDQQRFEKDGREFADFTGILDRGNGALRQRGLAKILSSRKPGGTQGKAEDFGPVGIATLKRTALTNTFSRAASEGTGRSLLAEIGRIIPGGLKGTPLQGILYSRQSIVGDSGRQYTPEQQSAMDRTGSMVTHKTIQETLKGLWQGAGKKLAQGLVDQFRPVRDLSDHAYTLMRLSKGATGAFEAFMHHGKLSLRDGAYDADTSGGVLETVFSPLGKESTDFLRWVAGNRAERLATEGKENLFSQADIGAFKSLANGTSDFDYTLPSGTVTRDRTLIYKDSLKKFNEFNKNVLDMAEQSGLIDGGSRHLWEHEFYVPFYRAADEEDGGVRGMNIKSGVVRQVAFQKLKGGEQQLNDLLENTLMNWSHLIDASSKNRAAKATLEAAGQVGAARPAMPGEKKTVWFMDGGQKVEYKVEDPYLMEAINSLEYAGLRGPAMDMMSATKHWLTIGVTASPFFKVRNLIRDSLQAIATSDLGYNPLANVKKGFDLTNRASQEYVSALAGGGLIRFGTMLEGSEAARTRQLIKQGAKDSHILDSEGKVRAFYDKFIEPGIAAYNEIGNRGEEINRMALYDTLIKKGVDHATASLMARDLMDFSMKGTWTSIRFLTQIVPFMNARMQGLYKLGRAAEQDKARFAIVLGGVSMVSLALLAAFGDDDDWKKREEWDRDNYWWFKFGGEAFRIPKPFEIGAIATLAERTAELLFDNEMTGKRFVEVTMNLASNQLAMNPVPQLFKPIIDLYANKDSFTGRQIETIGMERLSPEYRYRQSTSMVARGLSAAGNAVTGDNFLSPVQVDHVVRSYFGWLGSFAVGSADMAVRAASDQPTQPALDYWKFATGGMVSDLDGARSRYVTQMYDQARELEQAHATWRNLMKEGKRDEANEYRADHRDELAKYRRVEHVKKQAARLNERIKMIERSSMDSDEKRTKINALRNQQDQIARRLSAA